MALALNFQKWLKCSYSLLSTYIIQQTVDKNSQTYQVKATFLLKHQILVTNLQENV